MAANGGAPGQLRPRAGKAVTMQGQARHRATLPQREAHIHTARERRQQLSTRTRVIHDRTTQTPPSQIRRTPWPLRGARVRRVTPAWPPTSDARQPQSRDGATGQRPAITCASSGGRTRAPLAGTEVHNYASVCRHTERASTPDQITSMMSSVCARCGSVGTACVTWTALAIGDKRGANGLPTTAISSGLILHMPP